MYKAVKIKLYPNDEQSQLIDRQLSCARFVWNYYLNLLSRHYKIYGKQEGFKPKSSYDLSEKLTKLKSRKEFLRIPFAPSLQYKLQNLEQSFKDFWRRGYGYPKFQSKRNVQSMKYDQNRLQIKNNKIRIPKVGWMRFRGRLLDGQLRNGTLKGYSFGRYEMSLIYEFPDLEQEIIDTIGLDINCGNLTLSDGRKYKIQGNFFEDKIKRLQRKIENQVKGSNRRLKAKHLLAKWCYKASLKRRHLLQRLTTHIALQSENQAIRICLESLDIEQMQKNNYKNINKAMNETMFGNISRMFEYKTDVFKVNKFFPSSKLCCFCGYKNEALNLSDRRWNCPVCKASLDRDINAAYNIKLEYERTVQNAAQGGPSHETRREFNLKSLNI